MTKIGLISDTHNFLDDAVFNYFDKCDEIWHAGDFGTAEIADILSSIGAAPVRYLGISLLRLYGGSLRKE